MPDEEMGNRRALLPENDLSRPSDYLSQIATQFEASSSLLKHLRSCHSFWDVACRPVTD
jgi:hypothetical protein